MYIHACIHTNTQGRIGEELRERDLVTKGMWKKERKREREKEKAREKERRKERKRERKGERKGERKRERKTSSWRVTKPISSGVQITGSVWYCAENSLHIHTYTHTHTNIHKYTYTHTRI